MRLDHAGLVGCDEALALQLKCDGSVMGWLDDFQRRSDVLKLVLFEEHSGYCIEIKLRARVKQENQLESHFFSPD